MDDLSYIIQQCIKEDRKYQRIFYECFFAFTTKIVFRYVPDSESCSEIVQDSFIKAFHHLEAFFNNAESGVKLENNLMCWLKKIAVHTAIDHLRKNKRNCIIKPLPDTCCEDIAGPCSSENHLLFKELLEELSRLSPSKRIIFNLHAIDGYSHEEIAEMLNLTAGGVRAMYFKTRVLLQKRIYGDRG